MGKQVAFFRKNKLDFAYEDVTIEASEAPDFIGYIRDRKNTTGWMTTGSVDANNTTITADVSESKDFTDIILSGHNFKSYTLQHWDDTTSGWTDFSPAINEHANPGGTSRHSFAKVETNKIQLIIRETVLPNDEKVLRQFIATELIAQLNAWPIIKDAVSSRNRVKSVMLSGKRSIRENVGGFSCKLEVQVWRDPADLAAVEELYFANESFLVWLCGGDEAQFSSPRIGYRLEDIYLMKCENEYEPEWYHGLYTSGLNLKISLAEVVD